MAKETQGESLSISTSAGVDALTEGPPSSLRIAPSPGEPPSAPQSVAPHEAHAPSERAPLAGVAASSEPLLPVVIVSGLEGDAPHDSGDEGEGQGEPDHERVFYLTDEDFARQQKASFYDDADASPDPEPSPPPPSVALAHRRRLRRVVVYAMGTALMLCMVGVGHFLGRSLFSASANAASAPPLRAVPSTPPAATTPAQVASPPSPPSPNPAATQPPREPARKARPAPDKRR